MITIFTIEDGVVTRMSKRIPCPFCDGLFEIPRNWTADDAYRWLEFTHLLAHAEEIADYRELLPQCSRCQRYTGQKMTPADPLHRACYEASCHCDCSYPAPPADLTPKFEEAE